MSFWQIEEHPSPSSVLGAVVAAFVIRNRWVDLYSAVATARADFKVQADDHTFASDELRLAVFFAEGVHVLRVVTQAIDAAVLFTGRAVTIRCTGTPVSAGSSKRLSKQLLTCSSQR